MMTAAYGSAFADIGSSVAAAVSQGSDAGLTCIEHHAAAGGCFGCFLHFAVDGIGSMMGFKTTIVLYIDNITCSILGCFRWGSGHNLSYLATTLVISSATELRALDN